MFGKTVCFSYQIHKVWDSHMMTMKTNPLAPDFFFLILAHPVCKMWITQEPKKGSIMK